MCEGCHLAERLGHVVHRAVGVHHRVFQQPARGLQRQRALVVRLGRVMGAYVLAGESTTLGLRGEAAASGRPGGTEEGVHGRYLPLLLEWHAGVGAWRWVRDACTGEVANVGGPGENGEWRGHPRCEKEGCRRLHFYGTPFDLPSEIFCRSAARFRAVFTRHAPTRSRAKRTFVWGFFFYLLPLPGMS